MEAALIDFQSQVTSELRRLIARAVQINESGQQHFTYSSSTLLISFLVSDDPVSRWFRDYLEFANVNLGDTLARKGLSADALEQIRLSPPPEAILNQIEVRPAASAESILYGAREMLPVAKSSGPPLPIDVRHVMGALIYRHGEHEKDLMEWGINLVDWSNYFLSFIDIAHHDESPMWQSCHSEAYKTTPELRLLIPQCGLNSGALSPAAKKITDYARQLADSSISGPIPLTTTCLLLAMLEFVIKRPLSFDAADLLVTHLDPGWESDVARIKQEYLEKNGWAGYEDRGSATKIPLGKATTRLVCGVIQEARLHAITVDPNAKVEPRHLLAGLLLHDPDQKEVGARALLESLGIDIPSFRNEVSDFVENFARDRLVGFDADVGRGALLDVLGIDLQINPLAALIAAHSTEPPLAIGVFGEWGSGKTFFMDRLKNRIEKISNGANASGLPQSQLPFYKHIVQIKFNAWHYAESNLWASLTEHIFSELNLSGNDVSQEQERDDRRKELVEQIDLLKAQEVEAADRIRLAEDELRKAQEELKQAKARADQRILPVSDVLATIESPEINADVKEFLAELGLDAATNSAKELYTALTGARATLQQGQFLLTSGFKGGGKKKLAHSAYLLLILISGPLLALAISALVIWLRGTELMAQISGFVGGLTAMLSSTAVLVQKQADRGSRLLASIEQANQKLETAMDARRAADLKQVLQGVEERNGALRAAREEHENTIQEIEQKQSDLCELDPDQVLAKRIGARADSDDYRKYLGLMALISRDFNDLSEDVDHLNRTLLAAPNEENSRIEKSSKVINRIVLYIDDLDRCPPQRVVKVLEAIHLLMAIPLFVVVVGVDARWISRSLVHHYARMLRDDSGSGTDDGGSGTGDGNDGACGRTHLEAVPDFARQATPHDYLEKIFQIPLWLGRIGVDGARSMVSELVKRSSITVPEMSSPTASPPRDLDLTLAPGTDDGGPAIGGEQRVLDKAAAARTQLADFAQPSIARKSEVSLLPELQAEDPVETDEIDLVAPQLEILQVELDFMRQLAPLLRRSPRAVKRFVNLYRLIKAGLKPSGLATFISDEEFSDFKVVLFLLAVVTNLPGLSRPLVQGIRDDVIGFKNEVDSEKGTKSLAWLVERYLVEASEQDRRELNEWLSGAGQAWLKVPLLKLAEWIDDVGRFSFTVDQQASSVFNLL